MYKRQITNESGEEWNLLSDKEIDEDGENFVVQIKVGTRTAMNFWATISVDVGRATDEQILAAMLRTEEVWADLLA
jgi:hypothetical protein